MQTHIDHNKDKSSYSHDTEISCYCRNQDWLDYTGSQDAISVVHVSNNRRRLSISKAKSRINISGNTEYEVPSAMYEYIDRDT